MGLIDDIRNIVESLYKDQDLESDFLDSSTVKSLIDENYLSPEFNDYDDFLEEKKGLDYNLGKDYNEKNRRKKIAGKLNNTSRSAGSARKVQIEYFIGNPFPEGSGPPSFMKKDDLKEALPNLTLKLIYDLIKTEKDLKHAVILLNTLLGSEFLTDPDFDERDVPIFDFIPLLRLDEMFKPYFGNSLTTTYAYFRTIDVSESKKAIFRGIDMVAYKKYAKEHKNILEQFYSTYETTPKTAYYTQIFFHMQKLYEKMELPLVGSIAQAELRKYIDNDFLNNLASTLAKTYGQDNQAKQLFAQLASNVGLTAEETERFLYLFVFPDLDFSECSDEPPVSDEKEDDICEDDIFPPPPPSWVDMDPQTLYYNQSQCSYLMSQLTAYETLESKTLEDIKEEYKSQILENMLSLMGRAPTDEQFLSLKNDIEISQYYVNPKKLLKIKLLARLPKKAVIDIEETVPEDPPEARLLTYPLEEMFENLSLLSNMFQIYEQRMVVDLLRGNSLYYEGLNFSKEASLVEELSNNISDLISPIEGYENIEFYLLGTRIVSVSLTREGYKRKRIIAGLPNFSNSSPQSRPQTINFLVNLGAISASIRENSNLPYDEFVKNFFNPTPLKKETKNNLFNYSSGISQPNTFAKLEDVGKRSLDFVATEIKRGYANFSCMTEEEKEEFDKKAYAAEEKEKKLQFSKQLQISIEDRFFNDVPDIFEKISKENGKEALNALGKDLLNRLGVCGLGDLVALASSTLLSFMNPSEYMDELVKCAISKLDPETSRRLYNKIEQAQALGNIEKGTGFIQNYRSLVGDTIFPWESTVPRGQKMTLVDEDLLDLINVEDYSLRLIAFGDALVVSFNTSQLLDLLTDIPGGEWIRFFIEITDSILKRCKVGNGNGILTNVKLKNLNANWCEDKDSQAKMPKLKKVRSLKKPNIAEEIAENAKEIIINLAVKLITSAFKELMRGVSAALAADANYFKQGNVIPDFFQDDDYFYNIVRDSSQKASITDEQINQSVLETLQDMKIIELDEISSESVGAFLQNTSIVVGEKQKLQLLKGESSAATKRDILEANSETSLGKVFSKNPSSIDDVFEQLGQDIDLQQKEDKLSKNLEDVNVTSLFCYEDSDPFVEALRQNKGISVEEAKKLKEENIEREKEKLCNYMDMISNPVAPIFGNAFKKILSKEGPIYGTLSAEQFKILSNSMISEYSLLSVPLFADLYDPSKGFLDLMLHGSKGYGLNKREIKLDDVNGDAIISVRKGLEISTKFNYEPIANNDTYSFEVSGFNKLTLNQQNNGDTNITIGSKKVLEYEPDDELINRSASTIEYGAPVKIYSSSASAMYKILRESLNIDKKGFNKASKASEILEENFPFLVERYYGKVKREISASRAFSYLEWQSLYPLFTMPTLTKLLNPKKVVQDNSLFYQKLENDPRNLEKKKKLIYVSPFDKVLTKEDTVRISILSEMMVRTYAVEAIMKAFGSFRAFATSFYDKEEILPRYVESMIKEDLGENYNKFVDLALQVFLTKIDLDIVEIESSEVSQSLALLQANLNTFRSQEKNNIDDFLNDNRIYIEDVMSAFVRPIILKTIRDFNAVFVADNFALDQFTVGPMLKDGAINVIKDVTKANPTAEQSQPFVKEESEYKQTKLVLEKYIRIEDRDVIPSLLPSGVSKTRPDHLRGVVNLESWKQFLKTYKFDLKPYSIAGIWKSWKFGLRISYLMPEYITTGDVTELQRQQEKAYNIKIDSVTKSFTLIPLATAEKDIPLDQLLTPELVDQFDMSCLLYDLIRTEEYQNLFGEAIDIETLISLITIYNVQNFATALGSGSSGASDLNKWQQNKETFQNLKDNILELLEDF